MNKLRLNHFFLNKSGLIKIFSLIFFFILSAEFASEIFILKKREKHLKENSALLRDGFGRDEAILRLGKPDSLFLNDNEKSEFLFWTVQSSKGPILRVFDPFRSKGNFEVTIKVSKDSKKIEKIYSGIN